MGLNIRAFFQTGNKIEFVDLLFLEDVENALHDGIISFSIAFDDRLVFRIRKASEPNPISQLVIG
jgi:hypothetical protein